MDDVLSGADLDGVRDGDSNFDAIAPAEADPLPITLSASADCNRSRRDGVRDIESPPGRTGGWRLDEVSPLSCEVKDLARFEGLEDASPRDINCAWLLVADAEGAPLLMLTTGDVAVTVA